MIQNLKKLKFQKLALLGLGLDNRALLALLDSQKIKTAITVCDSKQRNALPVPKLKNLKINYQLGKNFNKNLDKFDILFRSPGWPLACPGIREALKKGRTKISSPLNLFFSLCPTKNIIGVTGTKGKGTTATLIYKILKGAGKRVWLGGNIGITPLAFINKIKPNDYVVLELSSFQLEDLKYSPRISIITNLFKEHLTATDPYNPNFHQSFNAYWRAKLNIVRWPQNKYLIINPALKNKINAELKRKNKIHKLSAQISETNSQNSKLTGKIIYFTPSSLPSKLIGDYNQENIGAAVAVAKILKIKPAVYEKTIANFSNLEHRLKFVANIKGVKYFNNSFSTTPESTILDLKTFREPIIQIGGGADKGADFRPLAKIIKQKVKFLILLSGRATPRIKRELTTVKFPKNKIMETDSMAEAVAMAKAHAVTGDVVLLSTACASFGLFKNYKERGDLFKKYVQKYYRRF